jgi:hypothetical protein
MVTFIPKASDYKYKLTREIGFTNLLLREQSVLDLKKCLGKGNRDIFYKEYGATS